MNYTSIILVVLLLAFAGGIFVFLQGRKFDLPRGETLPFAQVGAEENDLPAGNVAAQAEDGEISGPSGESGTSSGVITSARSNREIFVTDGTKHSIPLNEILSGGPGKDGIPSIDNPKFLSASGAAFLESSDIGLGLTVEGESRFYPYRILVWHEIVNDTVGGEPVLVTYCPLCATGVVFDRRVGGEVQEFGVSGLLWQSNLLMYNRAGSEDKESLWSQVLGEAVLGVDTGEKLSIIRSDVVRWSDWRKGHPDTKVLSNDTGVSRDYGRDPYGNYYTSESVSFGASFSDTRLHPKELVHGVEIDGLFKAYHDPALKVGTTNDTFAGKTVSIKKTSSGEITFSANGQPLPSIPGFWFSWIAVHPETELFF